MKDKESKERLYVDLAYKGSYYVTWNIDLLPAINEKLRLSQLEILLFVDIAMYYDSHRQTPCEYSYSMLADKYRCTVNGVRKSLSMLLEYKLIEHVNDRKGRTKFKYEPNVIYIKEMLIEYAQKT